MMDKAPKKKIVSVNFSHALFFWISLLLKIVPIGSPKMSIKIFHSMLRNISEEQISSHDLVIQDMLWLHVVWFRPIQFGASHAN